MAQPPPGLPIIKAFVHLPATGNDTPMAVHPTDTHDVTMSHSKRDMSSSHDDGRHMKIEE